MMARRPVPWRGVDGLAVYRFGAGAPVFFIPGPHRFQRPGTRSADALIEVLVACGRTVITFDPPGSGASARPPRLSLEEMLECTDAALEIAGVPGATDLVGHSMGGLVTLAYALARPQRVRRMVLIGTRSGRSYMTAPGALWNRSHPGFWRMAAWGILHELWPRLGPQTHLLNLIEAASYVDPARVEQEPVTWRDWLRPRVGRTDWQYVARKMNLTPRLGEISAPVLVLCGQHDPQFPPACSQELAAGIRHARLVFFAASGHYPFIEEVDAFRREVAMFLGEE